MPRLVPLKLGGCWGGTPAADLACPQLPRSLVTCLVPIRWQQDTLRSIAPSPCHGRPDEEGSIRSSWPESHINHRSSIYPESLVLQSNILDRNDNVKRKINQNRTSRCPRFDKNAICGSRESDGGDLGPSPKPWMAATDGLAHRGAILI